MPHPFSLSTSWNAGSQTSGRDIIEEIKKAGFDSAELGFNLTRQIVEDIIKLVETGSIAVNSIHNFCPIPDNTSPAQASPDYFPLSSPDRSIRRMAIDQTKQTIDYAVRLHSKAVILHMGRVEIGDKTRKLAYLVLNGKDSTGLRAQMINDRMRSSKNFLDSAIESLKELVDYSKRSSIKLAVENRYYFREIPSIDELRTIFGHFNDNEVFYWHDTGHAQVFENLGFGRHKDYLDSFSNRIIGMHIHDIIGIDDHRPPLSGDLDFSLIMPYIKREDILKVIEIHQPANESEVRRSLEQLVKLLKMG